MPATPLYIVEEAVTISLLRALGEHPKPVERVPTLGFPTQIFNPDGVEEERARGVHHSQVRQDEVAVVGFEALDDEGEEGMIGGGEEDVVGDAGGGSAAGDGGEGE